MKLLSALWAPNEAERPAFEDMFARLRGMRPAIAPAIGHRDGWFTEMDINPAHRHSPSRPDAAPSSQGVNVVGTGATRLRGHTSGNARNADELASAAYLRSLVMSAKTGGGIPSDGENTDSQFVDAGAPALSQVVDAGAPALDAPASPAAVSVFVYPNPRLDAALAKLEASRVAACGNLAGQPLESREGHLVYGHVNGEHESHGTWRGVKPFAAPFHDTGNGKCAWLALAYALRPG